MTDQERAVEMVRKGIEVFREMNKDVMASPNLFTAAILPVLLMASIQSVAYVEVIKLLAEIRNK